MSPTVLDAAGKLGKILVGMNRALLYIFPSFRTFKTAKKLSGPQVTSFGRVPCSPLSVFAVRCS